MLLEDYYGSRCVRFRDRGVRVRPVGSTPGDRRLEKPGARLAGGSDIFRSSGGTVLAVRSLMSDIRYAVRTFLRTPGFTIVAILTLALGIGATTTLFSIVNAVLLKPLPYPAADRLITMRGSLADLRDVEAAGRSFEGMAMWASNQYNLRTEGDARRERRGGRPGRS